MLPPRRLALILAGAADAPVPIAHRWLLGLNVAERWAIALTLAAASLGLTTEELGPDVRLAALSPRPVSCCPPSDAGDACAPAASITCLTWRALWASEMGSARR